MEKGKKTGSFEESRLWILGTTITNRWDSVQSNYYSLGEDHVVVIHPLLEPVEGLSAREAHGKKGG